MININKTVITNLYLLELNVELNKLPRKNRKDRKLFANVWKMFLLQQRSTNIKAMTLKFIANINMYPFQAYYKDKVYSRD